MIPIPFIRTRRLGLAKAAWIFTTTVGLPIIMWLFADTGKNWVTQLSGDAPETVAIQGDTSVSRQVNLAKMLGANATDPSAEIALTIPVARPSLDASASPITSQPDLLVLTNASPIRPLDQETVFSPGKCMFLGHVSLRDTKRLIGETLIHSLSCTSDTGNIYEIGDIDGPSIGFLAPVSSPTSHNIDLVKENKVLTVPRSGQYLLRLNSPLRWSK